VVQRFQILSLDGGGIRGIHTAAVLDCLERDFNTRIADRFDLIVGTSTGGILALGLGLGVPVAELLDLYCSEGRRIFPAGVLGSRWLRHWFRAKYSPRHLLRCVRLVFGERSLGDSRKALAIPYYDLGTGRPGIYKTSHHPDLRSDKGILAWQAAMGTTAAPSYLPASRHVQRSRHLDGGVWANNPVMVGVLEAYRFLGVPLENIRVLSLGTAECVKDRPGYLNWGGKLLWANAAAELIMRGQTDSATEMARHLLGEKHMLRVNPTVPPSWSALDRVMMRDEFLSRARSESQRIGPRFRELFLEHDGLSLTELARNHADRAAADI
jgi:patatin-like phospholipase/acyl hydrolase